MAKQYDITKLLENGAQPFDPIDNSVIDAIADEIRAMGRNDRLPVPIVLSYDGVLVDGHQRLTAMQRAGRTKISELDTKRLSKARCKGKTEIEIAVELNLRSRQLTAEDKARLVRKWVTQYGWSQTKIAGMMGISQPRVSQLIKMLPEEEEVEYDTGRPRSKPEAPEVKSGRDVLKNARRLREELTSPDWAKWVTDEHNPDDAKEIISALNAIADAVAVVAEQVESAVSDTSHVEEPF